MNFKFNFLNFQILKFSNFFWFPAFVWLSDIFCFHVYVQKSLSQSHTLSHSFTLSRHAEQLKTFHSHSIEDLVLYKECPVKYVDMESGSKGDFLTSYQAWSKSGSQNNRISFHMCTMPYCFKLGTRRLFNNYHVGKYEINWNFQY